MKEEKKECDHEFKYGYTMDIVVYCIKCKKEADEIYKGMKFNQQEKLVKE